MGGIKGLTKARKEGKKAREGRGRGKEWGNQGVTKRQGVMDGGQVGKEA